MRKQRGTKGRIPSRITIFRIRAGESKRIWSGEESDNRKMALHEKYTGGERGEHKEHYKTGYGVRLLS